MEKRQASSFYPHFSTAERPEVDKFVGFFNSLLYQRNEILTDFLNPGQLDILHQVFGNEFFIQEFGGWQGAEKKRVILANEWRNYTPADFKITPLVINYAQKFDHLSHSAILGSLANSGLALDTFGDIITDGSGNWQLMAKSELTDFFTEQVDRIGSSRVRLRPITYKEVLLPQDDSQNRQVVVPSLRLDALLSKISRQSRTQIQRAIAAGLVKINWHEKADSNIMVKVADVISLRHFGRVRLEQVASTRKGKYRVELRIWQTKRNR